MANKDLKFLQEMKALTASLLKDSYDIIKVQHLDQMVTDWIDEVKNNDCIADVSKQRELLIAFKNWEVDNDIKNLLPEDVVDFYIDESNL